MTLYAHTVFCDDIRQEVGGKFTLVGIYSGQCLVPSMPCMLPKLCVSISVAASRQDAPKTVNIKGTYAGDEVIHMSLDSAQIDSIMAANPNPAPDRKRMMLVLMAVISPFNVKEPGRLALQVMADDEELFTDSLEIGIAPPGTSFSM